VDSFLRSIEESPISVVQNGGVNLITAFFVREMIRTALYNPIRVYETLAGTLAGVLAGNYTGLFSPNTQEALCQQVPETSPPQTYTWAREATSGVICGDSYALAGDRNVSWARSLASRIIAQSPTTSDGWLRVALACAGWDISPDYVFHGPFGSPAPGNNSAPAAPLLILSTEVDHATPLENAFTLSRLHKGSSVVVQEGIGHCALLSSTSNCTSGIVREYFRTGTVPANGTFCASDCRPEIPFKGCPGLPGAA
jgi:autophagy-related protein 17